ncbi:hypothetical protein AB0M39_12130 [Streptomyces sp. NPDC051907]|uniref:hypothetical protein n=1 Tax=Streptomyces sp. NPDC051907 TaxID=3155284 RepID=UPI00342A698D
MVAVVFLAGSHGGTVWALVRLGALVVVASLAVGVALGALIGAVLAIAPRRLVARSSLRGLLAALTAGLPLATAAVALLTSGQDTLASGGTQR